MRIVLQHANVRPTDRLDRWVEERLASLRPLIRIDEAYIRLEYRHDASPAYRASAHLVIPGPDVRAEAVDHTAGTAVAKLIEAIREQAAARAARRLRRLAAPHPVRSRARFGGGRGPGRN